MKVININQSQLESLEKVKLDDRISNQEGTLYYLKNLNWQYSDLLSYNMMILDTIANDDISQLKIEDYYDYINYLKYLGFGKQITDSFSNIYSKDNNTNPVDYFDQIPVDNLEEAKYKTFKKVA